ncbi:MAG: type III polyketide synthase [Candidatus Latescibacteria bacterium]|nr:type III polyketide synthase [Candidatus Latescibacterota bacterium]
MPSKGTILWSIGTALPAHRISQEQACLFMAACFPKDRVLARRLRYLYRRSQIQFRHTCGAEFTGMPGDLAGEAGTAQRMAVYEKQAAPLAEAAARQALQDLFQPDEITHLIAVTCTGFFAPGPELVLVERLGLRREVRRLQIGFMGCQAALQGLQMADAICRSDAAAVVLLVCVELCTLHFCRTPTEENLVVNSLFADGAAAALLSAPGRRQGRGLCALEGFASYVVPHTPELLSWRIGDQGFRMGLDVAVPRAVGRAVPAFVEGLLAAGDWVQDQVDFWAVHPGGRAILEAVERALALPGDALEPARAVLREYGNMSSPTLLFVLDRILAQGRPGRGVALSFGPGLSLEGMRWRRGNSG